MTKATATIAILLGLTFGAAYLVAKKRKNAQRGAMMALLALLAFGPTAWAQNSWDEIYAMTQTTSADWTALAGSTTGQTLGSAGNTTYYYANSNLSFTNSNAGGSGLTIRGTVYLYIPSGTTLTCTGANASGTTGGGAGIELTEGNTLCLIGSGTVNATGGNAANGGNGGNGNDAECTYDVSILGGSGGNGGNGGGGAGAGIGTRGANGGNGGAGGQRNGSYGQETTQYGVDGNAGSAGSTAGAMGNLYVVTSSVNLSATGGSAGSSGTGGNRGLTASQHPGSNLYMASGGGGGGAGGFGGGASNIGTGGPGGGGGGGGAAGNVAWVVYSGTANGYYHAGAKGGKGGTNGDSTSAPDGTSIELDNPIHADIQAGGLRPNASDYTDDAGWEDGNAWHDGGAGGDCGYISLVLWPTQGAGTEESPYLISSADEWNTFAANVSNGNNYSGKYIKLSNNISVSTMAGNSFSGTFDGNGKTITANISGTGTMALFNSLNGGTIKNLTVAGSISGGIHTAALLVTLGNSGTNLIENCVVTANINCSSSHMGGFLAHGNESNITIRGCVFKGKMTGGSSAKGVFYGWGSSPGTVTGCLYIMANGQDTDGLDLAKGNGTVTVTNCYKTTNVGSYGTEPLISAQAPSGIGNLEQDYGILKVFQNGLQYDGKYYYAPATSNGSFTENDPYIINSSDDWNDFVRNVSIGHSYSGQYVKLASNITFNTMAMVGGITQIGESYQPFSGTFDGDGHTITFFGGSNSRFIAPFKCVSGATIKNLHTEGTFSGTYDVSGKLLAGIVGVSYGSTTITGCRSSVKLTDYAADGTLAGIVGGMAGGSLTISGCVFDGSMARNTGNHPAHCVGIAGYEYAATTAISNTLFAPSELTVSIINDGYTNTFTNDGDATITNCYYTRTLGTEQGIGAISTTQAPQGIGNLLQDYGMVTAYEHGLLFGGKYYFAPATSAGTGTEGDPYIISNSDQWLTFVAWVNGGESFSAESFSGKYVRLTQDISISTPVGSRVSDSDNKPFSGTFLGDGHTITVTLTDDGKQGLAPFRYIDGATIKNLKVAGTIASSQYHSAGVVGFASGTNTIEGCVVTATLNISSDYAGGIIGHGLTSTTTITGCVFAGTINGVDGNHGNIGGIWGWSDNATPTLEDCMEAGTYTNIASMHPMGLQSNKGTITNCYYVNPQVGEPRNACTVSGAKQAYAFTTTHDDLGELEQDYGMVQAYENGILYDGTYYVALTNSISLTVEGYGESTESDHWAFIASPVEGSIEAETVGNIFSASEYDLYRFNPSVDLEWENWKQEGDHHHFNLENGRGYLYATKETKTLGFSGTFNEDDEMTIANLPQGFNLVGNPFTTDAYINKPYYTLNEDGSAILSTTSQAAIAPCHGVIVEVDGNGTVTFSKTAPAATANQGMLNITVAEQKADTRGASTGSATAIDNAIVRFGEGEQLGKFHFGNPSANISIPQGGKEYAVANVNVGTDVARNVSTNEMPANFKASKDGEYTISFNPENVEFDYLHLIDNLTGSDVDLLALRQAQGPASYTFTAKTTDYASRFRLVFSASGDACEPSGNFAFISNGNIIVNGEGTLQVVDVTGRVIVCRDASHASAISTSRMTPGIYVLRLIEGNNVRIQKIVIE